MNYTYIVKCCDGSLYTGWTNNIEKRINDHNNGKGAKYTKSRLPVALVYYEEFGTKEEAMRREWEIKQLGRKEKLKLIEAPELNGRTEKRKIETRLSESYNIKKKRGVVMRKFIGVDLGGTNIRAAVVQEDGKILCMKKAQSHPERGAEPVMQTMIDLIEKLRRL